MLLPSFRLGESRKCIELAAEAAAVRAEGEDSRHQPRNAALGSKLLGEPRALAVGLESNR